MNTGSRDPANVPPPTAGASGTPVGRPMQPRLHDLAAQYEITRELGRGGTAVVYHARERDLGREVAIKVVHQTHVDDAEAVARLAREARLIAQLRHPNIVTLFGTRHLADGSLALIMQYVPGRTLKAAIREDGPLTIAAVESVLREMALALHHAHQRQGLVHRDVKPENIYLDAEGGRTLLSDFGIARTNDVESSLTLVGTALGTPAYMSPEQIDGLTLDGRSDLYSLGLVAYEMLTGSQPWAGHNLYTIIYKQKHEELPPLSEFRRDVPPRMQRAIDGMLRKDREQRWRDAARFLSALIPAAGSGAITPPAMTQRPRARSAPPDPIPDDSPTIVYRPQDDPYVSGVRRAADLSVSSDAHDEAVISRSSDVQDDLVVSRSPDVQDDAVVSRWPDVQHDPVVSPSPHVQDDAASPATASSSAALWSATNTPVLRFLFDSDDTAEQSAAPAPADSVEPRRMMRVPLLIGLALLLTLAGAVVPLIDGADDESRDPSALEPWANPASAAPASASTPAAVDGHGAPARLVVLTDNQTGHVGEPLPLPVGLLVEDADGRPVAGASVELEVVSGDGSVDPAVAVSDSRGLAMTRWTLGDAPGPNDLRARVRGMSELVVVFSATGVAGAVERLVTVAGADQAAPRGGILPDPVVVRVEDANGNPVGGARVDFSIASGGGAVQPAAAITDTAGLARTSWTIGSVETNTLRATVAASELHIEISARAEYRLSVRPQLVTGGTHTCVLAAPGGVSCWGANDNGQLGAGTSQRVASASVVSGSPPLARLAAGVSHTCALDRDGAARCWGGNGDGQLGTGDRDRRALPSPVRTAESFADIAAGLGHTCALAEGGRAFCWGDGSSGQTGDGSANDRSAPVRVAGAQTFTSLSAGWRHTCGLTSRNVVYCWGGNGDGQLGDGTATTRTSPVRVAGEIPFIDISAGAAHSCGVTAGGDAYCWGQNGSGQLGSGTRTDSPRPLRVQTDVPFISTVAGAVHTCALARAGEVYCWGRNNLGQLGNDGTTDSPIPVAVAGGLRFTSLTASGSHTCGRADGGDYYCWGYNVEGQLGDGTRTDRSRPVRLRVAAR